MKKHMYIEEIHSKGCYANGGLMSGWDLWEYINIIKYIKINSFNEIVESIKIYFFQKRTGAMDLW